MKRLAIILFMCVGACAHTQTRAYKCPSGEEVWVKVSDSTNEYLARTVETTRGMRKCARRALVEALEEE